MIVPHHNNTNCNNQTLILNNLVLNYKLITNIINNNLTLHFFNLIKKINLLKTKKLILINKCN